MHPVTLDSHTESDEEERVQLACFHAHAKEVFSVAFSPDGEFLASCSRDKSARVYSMDTSL